MVRSEITTEEKSNVLEAEHLVHYAKHLDPDNQPEGFNVDDDAIYIRTRISRLDRKFNDRNSNMKRLEVMNYICINKMIASPTIIFTSTITQYPRPSMPGAETYSTFANLKTEINVDIDSEITNNFKDLFEMLFRKKLVTGDVRDLIVSACKCMAESELYEGDLETITNSPIADSISESIQWDNIDISKIELDSCDILVTRRGLDED